MCYRGVISIVRTEISQNIMRAVFNAYIGRGIVVLLVGLVLSITAMQYFSNKLTQGVQVTTPANAGTAAK